MIHTEAWYKESDARQLSLLERNFLQDPSVETARPLLHVYFRGSHREGVESVWAGLDLDEIASLPEELQPQLEYSFYSLVLTRNVMNSWSRGPERLEEDGPFHVDYTFSNLLAAIEKLAPRYHDATLDGMETLVKWVDVIEFDEHGEFIQGDPYGVGNEIDDWVYNAFDSNAEFPGTYHIEFHLLAEPLPRDLLARVRKWSQSLSRQPSMAIEEED